MSLSKDEEQCMLVEPVSDSDQELCISSRCAQAHGMSPWGAECMALGVNV
jgi:hypothetical protein